MKKLFLLLLSAFCLGSCSVDTLEIEPVNSQLLILDATYSVDGCDITTFNFGEAGRIEVRNDLDFIYVKLFANAGYEIIESYLHIATDISGFPLVGNSSNPGISLKDMQHQLSFKPSVNEYTYEFPLDSYGDSFLVASYTAFQLGKKKYNLWAGDVKANNWSYFEYNLFDHPNAGADNSGQISLSDAKALPSWDETRKVFTSLLDPGVPEGQFVGSFEPTILEIIDRFNDPEKGGIGEYTAVYTIGEGNCTDSVTLTINVVADNDI